MGYSPPSVALDGGIHLSGLPSPSGPGTHRGHHPRIIGLIRPRPPPGGPFHRSRRRPLRVSSGPVAGALLGPPTADLSRVIAIRRRTCRFCGRSPASRPAPSRGGGPGPGGGASSPLAAPRPYPDGPAFIALLRRALPRGGGAASPPTAARLYVRLTRYNDFPSLGRREVLCNDLARAGIPIEDYPGPVTCTT